MLHYYFRLAFARLRRTPGLTILMVLGLAVGIGASMTTITLRYVLGLNPVPGKSTRLLNLQDPSAGRLVNDTFDYTTASALARVASNYADSVISGAGITTTLSIAGQRRQLVQGVGIRYTTRPFFRVFNVPLVRGRAWTREEYRNGAPVLVLSKPIADYLFDHSEVIGKRIRIGRTVYTVIGVSGLWNPQPRYYDLASAAGAFGGGGDGIFMPITAIQYAPDSLLVSRACPGRSLKPFSPSQLLSSRCRWLNVWYLARHRGDVGVVKKAVQAQLPGIFIGAHAPELRLLSVEEMLANADIIPGTVRVYAWLGMAFLILCVVNASGMQLSRVMRSRNQIGVRRALGARRSEIVKQYLCDAVLISGIGGILGIVFSYVGLYIVRHVPSAGLTSSVYVDQTMFAVMVMVVLACGLLVGVAPAWLASRTDPALLIKATE